MNRYLQLAIAAALVTGWALGQYIIDTIEEGR
jgi:hypothetical protein